MKFLRVLFAAFAAGLALTGSTLAATEGWLDDYDSALARAKADKKLLFVLFTASDVSTNCKKLSKEVLETKEFKEYAAKNLVLLEVDFPKQKEQSMELKQRNKELNVKLGGRSFPVIVLLDGEGKEQTRFSGYGGGGAKDMIAKVELFRTP